jgi:hypothetical protein
MYGKPTSRFVARLGIEHYRSCALFRLILKKVRKQSGVLHDSTHREKTGFPE